MPVIALLPILAVKVVSVITGVAVPEPKAILAKHDAVFPLIKVFQKLFNIMLNALARVFSLPVRESVTTNSNSLCIRHLISSIFIPPFYNGLPLMSQY